MGFKLIWHDRGVTKQYFGILTGDDILDSVQQVEAEERFDDLRYAMLPLAPTFSCCAGARCRGSTGRAVPSCCRPADCCHDCGRGGAPSIRAD
jgi:hypothetical protein